MSNKKSIGIDLASSQSVVAIINEMGQAEVIENEEGRRITPSVVMIKDGERKIGSSAQRQAIMNPKNTIALIKRFMGGAYDSENIKKAIEYATFEVVNKGNKPYVKIDGKEYSPEEISSYIISYLKKQAEAKYGCEVDSAVITCPAFYNDTQRQAVKAAGELAGLNVLRVINEPTAAVLAATNLDLTKDKKILVVDLGGSTLDFSLCDVSKIEGQEVVEILASYGDTFLGGADFDKEIVNYVCDEFAKDHSGFDLRKDPMAYSRIVEAAEKAKCELSTSTQTEINLPYITSIDNIPQMLVTTINRATYERLTQHLVDRMINCGRECLKKAGVNKTDLDEILLVGGMTRSLNVQEALSKEFGCPLDKSVNPDEAVALGAAVQAGVLTGESSNRDILLLDVTPISLGIDVNGGMMHKLIEANTTIPTQKKEVFTTAVDNQPAVDIQVLQGERPMAADNKIIGTFQLDGIMPARRGVPQIEVTFDIDANGILSVTAKDLGTQKEQHITIKDSNSLSKEEIERIKANAEAFKAEDEKRVADAQIINGADTLAFAIEKAVEENKEKLTEEQQKQVADAIAEVRAKVQTKNVEDVKTAQKALEDVWYPIVQTLNPQATDPAQAAANPFAGAGFGDNPFAGAQPQA